MAEKRVGVVWAASATATIFWEDLDNAFEKLCSVEKKTTRVHCSAGAGAGVTGQVQISKRFERLSLFGSDNRRDEELCDG
jgi:hypothetical protein